MSLSFSSSLRSEELSVPDLASRAVQTVAETATALAKVTKTLDESAKAAAKRLQALKDKAAAEAASADNGQALEEDSFHQPQDEPRFEWTFISRIAPNPAQTQAQPYTSHEDVDTEKPIACAFGQTVTDKQIDDALQANPAKLYRLAATPESLTFSFSLRVVQRAKALVNVADGVGDGQDYRGFRGCFAYFEGVALGESVCPAGYVIIEQYLPATSGD